MKVNLDLLVKAIWDGKGVKEGEKELSNMEKQALSFAKAGTAAFATIGAAALKFGADSLKAFTGFEKGMNEVFTLLPGITGDAMESMKESVLSFSQESGRLSTEVVPALYQAISAGVPQANVFDFMKIASDAALGGVTDLETAVDGITSVVNAYGEETVNATQASDMMFTAVKLGKTNFEQLSRFLFQVIPTASALGVEFGDITAALAAMTAQGTPTSVATTQLRQMLVELSKEGSKTSATFKEVAGVGFKEFIAGGGNVQQALQLLEQHAADSGVGLNDLFSSVEAGAAALSLTGKGTDAFTNALDAMDNSAGATATAAETMGGTLEHLQGQTAASYEKVKVLVGEALEPGARAALEFANSTLTLVGSLMELSKAAEDASAARVEEATTAKEAQAAGNALITTYKDTEGFLAGISGASGDLTDKMTDLAVKWGDFSGDNEQLRASLEELFGTTVELKDGIISVDGVTLAHAASLRDSHEAAVVATKGTEQLTKAIELSATAMAEATTADTIMTAKTYERVEAVGEVSEALVTQEDITKGLIELTKFQAEQAKIAAAEEVAAAEAAAEALAKHNAMMGGFFMSAIQASEGIGFFNETAAEMADRTITVSNLTGDQQAALNDLREEYAKAEQTISDYTIGAKGVGLTAEQVAEKVNEQQERMAELSTAMEPLIGAGSQLADVQGTQTVNQEAINQALFDSVAASDASAVQLALLGEALGLYSEEAAMAALQSALIQEKINQLAAAYVAGDVSIAQMREELNLFIEDVSGTAEAMLSATDSTTALADASGSLGAELNTVTSEAIGVAEALNAIPSSVHVSVTTDPMPTVPTFPGGQQEQAFASGGYTGGTRGMPAGVVHGEEYVFSAQSVDRIGLANLQALDKGGGASGQPVQVYLAIDARGAAAGVGREVEAAGRALSNQIGRAIDMKMRGK